MRPEPDNMVQPKGQPQTGGTLGRERTAVARQTPKPTQDDTNSDRWPFWRPALVALVFFGTLVAPEFSSDAYVFYTESLQDTVHLYLAHGRFIPALEWWALKGLDLPVGAQYLFCYLGAILSLTAGLFFLEQAAASQCPGANRHLLAPVAAVILVNPFTLDLFLWSQKDTHVLAVLACVLAVRPFLRVLDGTWSQLGWVWFWLTLANFAYQGPLALFVCLALVFVGARFPDRPGFLRNNLVTALAFGVPVALNYWILRALVGHERLSRPVIWSETLAKVRNGLADVVVHSFGVLPDFVYALVTGLVLVLVILYLGWTSEAPRQSGKLVWELLTLPYLVAGSLAVTMAPHMGIASDMVWVAPRNVYAAGGLPGLLLLYLLLRREIPRRTATILTVGICMYLAILHVAIQRIVIDHYAVNRQDREIVLALDGMLKAHEARSGTPVTRIAVCSDASTLTTYPGLFWYGDTNMRALGFEKGAVAAIRFYTGRTLHPAPPLPQFEAAFRRRNWDAFSPDQVRIVGDTLHLCVF